MAPDPIGPVDSKSGKINDKILTEPQRLNAYAYALNGPGRYVDRDGDCAWLVVPVAIYLLLHNSDVANTATSPSEPTYTSNGAADIVSEGILLYGVTQAVQQAANSQSTTLPQEVDLNPRQSASLERFQRKLPNGAKTTEIHDLPSGGKAFQSEVPGRVPGSSATYEK